MLGVRHELSVSWRVFGVKWQQPAARAGLSLEGLARYAKRKHPVRSWVFCFLGWKRGSSEKGDHSHF